ncbi:kininogen-1-like [Abrus precatorius]|uniref:Kininogen-1-like n=1 Tax=Abrus precatorius TaxID=3816 RepID=A0A8B8L061_ABRPR|nr:kininogen-1-like [Abrus precatorius]
MSLQQQPQQPVQVYPSTVTNQAPSHHSNGSFGAVFIVLAIILVISVVACFLGRLCNRRYNNNHSHSQRPTKQQRPQIHNLHQREEDIEFGVDKRIPVPPPILRPKGNGHGPDHGHHPHAHGPDHGHHPHAHGHGHGHGHVDDHNMKDFEMRPGLEGELRAGA